MAAIHHLVELKHLGDEGFRVLESSSFGLLSDAGFKRAIVGGPEVAARKEVAHDALKEWDIQSDELWQVHIRDAPEDEDGLLLLWKPLLELPGCFQDCLDSPHAVVVVMLR